MAGSHGGRWSYREDARSSSYYSIGSSSTSGTLSTAYTSSGSHMSSAGYLASAMHVDFELGRRAKAEEQEEEQMHHIASLVREFFGGDVSVLERWLTELDIGWVLHLPHPDATSARELDQTYYYAPSWIRAFTQIVEIIGFTGWFFPEQGVSNKLKSINFVDFEEELPNIYEEEEQADIPDRLQFAKFFQEAMFKMLPFVDWIVNEVLLVASNGIGVEPLYENLSTLLGVHGALSKALPQIKLASSSLSSTEVLRIQHDVVSLLAAKEVKAGRAIWSIMEEIKTRILELMEDGDDSSGTVTLEGSSQIHKATRSVISYIELLRANYSSSVRIVSDKYWTPNAAISPLDSMIIEIASCLEEKLAKESESFPDRSLRFLFLFNNSNYIWSAIEADPVVANSISFSSVQTHEANTTRKVRSYMESYMQASWSPVLSCLFDNNPTPFRLAKNKICSQLAKFEFEFHKIYTTQKLWKVPDPSLRKSLREAITMKIMPDYTKYIEDNNITNPRIAPQELEKMLQELFEG